MSYTFSIVEFPTTQIAGITIETDMQHAGQDCPSLWQKFAPRICAELVGHASLPNKADTFGLCRMLDENRFIYWAAIEINSTENLPTDMKNMIIPAGLYVKCTAPNLEKLSEVFTAIYMQWSQSQDDYVLDMQGISFERYKSPWEMSDPIEVYVSVLPKS